MYDIVNSLLKSLCINPEIQILHPFGINRHSKAWRYSNNELKKHVMKNYQHSGPIWKIPADSWLIGVNGNISMQFINISLHFLRGNFWFNTCIAPITILAVPVSVGLTFCFPIFARILECPIVWQEIINAIVAMASNITEWWNCLGWYCVSTKPI